MACLKCKSVDSYPWKVHRESLLRYWIQCRERNIGFGYLGRVNKVVNKRARCIMCTKYNVMNELEVSTPAPPCVVDGLSFLFPAEEFTDGTTLPELLVSGERPRKRSKVTIDININKNV